MMDTNPDIPVGSTWRERARPGHTVEVIEVKDPLEFIYKVIYKHLNPPHNQRVQSHPTSTTPSSFLSRYERISVSTPDKETYDDDDEQAQTEQPAPLEITRLYLTSMDDRMVKFDDVTHERRRQLLMSDPRTMTLNVRPDHWESIGRPVELIITLENGK